MVQKLKPTSSGHLLRERERERERQRTVILYSLFFLLLYSFLSAPNSSSFGILFKDKAGNFQETLIDNRSNNSTNLSSNLISFSSFGFEFDPGRSIYQGQALIDWFESRNLGNLQPYLVSLSYFYFQNSSLTEFK